MAHEFKTPLTNIGLASNMLLKRQEDPLISIIHSENKQLTSQVNNVLSMASLESGQFEIKKENVNIHLLINEVVESMHMQIFAKNGIVEIHGIDDSMFISADRFHLANALKNILENAIKYNNNDPVIDIIGKVQDENIIISIQDNGVGIAPENQQLVFEKFFRLQKTQNSSNRGFGLGLSYVKKIINLHNGHITIFSEWKKGTRFDIQFPKAI
jgi:signal transduction histidine kinase